VSEVTRILEAIQQGDANAAAELLPLVYEELRRLAAHRMANEPPGQTLQPTALVHEAWLRWLRSHAPLRSRAVNPPNLRRETGTHPATSAEQRGGGAGL
jgi:DNA-directed RNA polymerase specialized sigma24 family protein